MQSYEMQLKQVMAERTGLEPATPGVTGRYSNQLNYRSWQTMQQLHRLWLGPVSNREGGG